VYVGIEVSSVSPRKVTLTLLPTASKLSSPISNFTWEVAVTPFVEKMEQTTAKVARLSRRKRILLFVPIFVVRRTTSGFLVDQIEFRFLKQIHVANGFDRAERNVEI
jgi:hypothetical protein